MTITGYELTQLGEFTLVEATSDLASPTFFWYVDGAYYQRTDLGELTVRLASGDQADVVAVDTTDPDNFDVVANAPTRYPARRTLWWTRSTDADVVRYVIKQQREAEGLVEIGDLPATESWAYRFLTPRLDDLTQYDWEVIPVDAAGNEGTALTFGPEQIVRKPDAPDFTLSFDEGTTRVTFTAA